DGIQKYVGEQGVEFSARTRRTVAKACAIFVRSVEQINEGSASSLPAVDIASEPAAGLIKTVTEDIAKLLSGLTAPVRILPESHPLSEQQQKEFESARQVLNLLRACFPAMICDAPFDFKDANMVAFAKALRQPPAVLSEADSFSDFQKASEQRIFLMMDKELGRCFGPLLANEAVSSMLSKMVLKLEKGEDGEDGEGGEGEEGNEGEDEGKEGEGNKGVCAALLPLLDLEVSDCEQIVALASNAKIADMERKDLAQAVPLDRELEPSNLLGTDDISADNLKGVQLPCWALLCLPSLAGMAGLAVQLSKSANLAALSAKEATSKCNPKHFEALAEIHGRYTAKVHELEEALQLGEEMKLDGEKLDGEKLDGEELDGEEEQSEVVTVPFKVRKAF
ncbi:unnamed protein product, partial [Effrenium voratum]